jgi:ribosome maturation protein SDO1
MTQTTARIKKAGKEFEIVIDMEKALAFKKNNSGEDFLEMDKIFSDSKKGLTAPSSDLKTAFGTEDVNEIAKKIVKEGEILLTQQYRDEERDKKYNQAVDFLSRNAIDPQTGNPHTPQRIRDALEQANINLKNTPIESQIAEIIEKISPILPIKVETKVIKITIPAIYTSRVYGIVNQYKEDEQWLNDGGLVVLVRVPAGIIMDFYDKLNSITHGSAITEEIKQ